MIAFDNSSQSSIVGNTTLTFSHTVSGSDTILWVAFGASIGSVTSVKYNGVSMTHEGTGEAQANGFTFLYSLAAPADGANNVEIIMTASSNIWGTVGSYTGAAQSGIPDDSSSGAGSGTTETGTVTTVADNCWTVMAGFNNSAGLAAGTATTMRESVSRQGLFDSNSAKTPVGGVTLEFTGGNDTHSHVIASFAPVAEVVTFIPKIVMS